MTPEEQAAKKAQEEEINQILFKDFKQFADSAKLYFANDFFALRVNVGSQGFTYVLTPYLAKKLGQIFTSQIALYEKIVREIVTEPPPLSPLQMDDLQKPEDPENGPEDSDRKPDEPSGKPKKG